MHHHTTETGPTMGPIRTPHGDWLVPGPGGELITAIDRNGRSTRRAADAVMATLQACEGMADAQTLAGTLRRVARMLEGLADYAEFSPGGVGE